MVWPTKSRLHLRFRGLLPVLPNMKVVELQIGLPFSESSTRQLTWPRGIRLCGNLVRYDQLLKNTSLGAVADRLLDALLPSLNHPLRENQS
ncbi:MAG: hypothetical protein ACI84R_002033 [Candidatus Azotimanducaceae bacterium]|jgi:hypothetical protein